MWNRIQLSAYLIIPHFRIVPVSFTEINDNNEMEYEDSASVYDDHNQNENEYKPNTL